MAHRLYSAIVVSLVAARNWQELRWKSRLLRDRQILPDGTNRPSLRKDSGLRSQRHAEPAAATIAKMTSPLDGARDFGIGVMRFETTSDSRMAIYPVVCWSNTRESGNFLSTGSQPRF